MSFEFEITIDDLFRERNVIGNLSTTQERDKRKCQPRRKRMTNKPLVVVGSTVESIDSATHNYNPHVVSYKVREHEKARKADIAFPGFVTNQSSRNNKNDDIVAWRKHKCNLSPTPEIVFCDVPYCVTAVERHSSDRITATAVVSTKLTLQEFYQEKQSTLPAGIRKQLRKRVSKQQATKTSSFTAIVSSLLQPQPQQHQASISYRDAKNAVELLNPWFHYTETFHECRTEYNISHRSIDMLSVLSLNKDILRELFVEIYGQKYMIKAPDIHTEFHHFISYFWKTFQKKPTQIWIDLQMLNETYGSRYNESGNKCTTGSDADMTNLSRHPSIGSLSTIPQSNHTQRRNKGKKIIPSVFIEV